MMEHIDEEPEPEGLLEECWFFGNSLDRKAKKAMMMLRCYSDPSPSSTSYSSAQPEMLASPSSSYSSQQEKLLRSSSGKKSPSVKKKGARGSGTPNLTRAPSLPPCFTVEEDQGGGKESSSRTMSKSSERSPRQNLLRSPSLPPCFGRDQEDAESEFTMSKLIRQANSLNLPQDLLPPRHTSKGMKQSSNAPPRQQHPEKNREPESIGMEDCTDHQPKTRRKSLSDVEIEETREFKGLGFKYDRKDLNPTVKRPISNWVEIEKSSSEQDMKAQIKFWARAVAANVR